MVKGYNMSEIASNEHFLHFSKAESHSSVGRGADLRTGSCWFDLQARPIFFPRIDDSHCDRIHSCLTAVRCFDNNYLGKQPVAWIEYCVEYWLKELHKSMDTCTGLCDITEMLLKMALHTVQSDIFQEVFGLSKEKFHQSFILQYLFHVKLL